MSLSKNMVWSPKEYADAAFIAREASEEMLTRLDWMTIKPKVILDIGCGTGESSLHLSKRYPEATVLAFDLSFPMIQHAKQHTSLSACICGQGETLPLKDHSVDLIFANFFLPWQQNVKSILHEWLRVLSPNGLVMMTSLGLDTLQEWKETNGDQCTPICIDMHDVGDALIQTGFSDPILDVQHYELTYRDHDQMVNELLNSGLWFPNEDAQKFAQPLTPTLTHAWSTTYEIIYAHAFAPEIKTEYAPSDEGVVKIPLTHLKRKLTE